MTRHFVTYKLKQMNTEIANRQCSIGFLPESSLTFECMSCSRNQIIKRHCTISILIRFSRFVQDINYDWMYHLLCLVLLICEIIIPPSSTLVTFQIDAVL